MIKITTAIKAQGGWQTATTAANAAVVKVQGYTLSQSEYWYEGSDVTKDSNINITFQIWKSLQDKEAGESSFQPKDFQLSINAPYTGTVELNETVLDGILSSALTDLGYTNSII